MTKADYEDVLYEDVYESQYGEMVVSRINAETLVNNIFSDFEARTCANCGELNKMCEMYPAAWNWLRLSEHEFSCNQWNEKALKDK